MGKREQSFAEMYHRDTLRELDGDDSPTAQRARQRINELLSGIREREEKDASVEKQRARRPR